jgi:hypothetical protein
MTAVADRALLVEFGACDLQTWLAGVARVAEGVVQANARWLNQHLGFTEMLARGRGGIVYQPRTWQRQQGMQVWPCRTAEVILHEKRGNCLELACLLAAIRRRKGNADATVEVVEQPDGNAHAFVVWRDPAPGRSPRRLDPAAVYPTQETPS